MVDAWYNRNRPAIVGPELVTTIGGADDMKIGGLARGRIQRFRSTTAETVSTLVWCSQRGDGGRYAAEVFAAGTEVPQGLAKLLWLPSRFDVAGTPGAVTDFAGGTTNLHVPVADGLDTTGLRFTQPASGQASIYMGFNGSAPPGRVLGISVTGKVFGPPGAKFMIWVYSDTSSPVGVVEDLGVIPCIQPFFFPPLVYQESEFEQVIRGAFWSASGLTSFNSAFGNCLRVQITLDPTSVAAGDQAFVSELRLSIATCAENRLFYGVGGHGYPAGLGVAHTFPTWQAVAGSSWNKVSGEDLSVLIRPLDATSNLTLSPVPQGDYEWMYSTGADEIPLGITGSAFTGIGAGSGDVSIDAYGQVVELGEFDAHRMHSFGFATGGGTSCVDSQPYTSPSTTPLSSGTTYYQKFTTVGAITVPAVRLVVRRAHDGDPTVAVPTQQLLVLIERVSDGLDFGSGFLTPEGFLDPSTGRDLGGGYRLVDIPLNTPAVLAAATQYRTVVACIENDSWEVCFQTVVNPAPSSISGWGSTDAYGRTWGGTTDVGGAAPPGDLSFVDMLVAALTTPATSTITGLTATVATQFFENLARCGGIAEMPYVQLRWTIPGTPATGDVFQVQRRDYPDGEWFTIFVIGAVVLGTTTGVDDFMSYPDATSEYRVRLVKADTTYGAWAHISVAVNGGPLMCFTSNERPDLNYATDDVGLGVRPKRIYQPLDGIEFAQPADAAYQTGTIDRLRRGVSLTRTVTIGDAAPKQGAYQHVDPLLRILRLGVDPVTWEDAPDPIESFCVRERHGGRWYMHGHLDGVEIIPFGNQSIETATVTVTEVSIRPPVVYR